MERKILTIDNFIEPIKRKIGKVDTIEDLKMENFQLGDVIEILGYNEIDDGGYHKRVIRESNDGTGVQLNNKLWANLLNEVNIDETQLQYSLVGDKVVNLGNYPNIVYKINTGVKVGQPWLGVILVDRYTRLDTPFWKDVLSNAGVWQDLVNYLNQLRQGQEAVPSERLKQFCDTNGIK